MSHDTEILRALELLFQPGDVFETRVLDAERASYRHPHAESGYFDYEHRADVPRALAQIATAAGVYVTINPVAPALLARSANRLNTARRNETTGNADILHRRWLFIDIDPVRPAGISATDAEKSLAFDRTMEVREGLASMGWPQPVVVDSGNGCYLLYRIDLPGDDGGLVQRCLRALQPLSDGKVHIDLSVANAARICRLPGTWNRKGDDMPDRPHRLAAILDAPEAVETVSQTLLEDLAARAAPDTQPPPAGQQGASTPPLGRPGDAFNGRGEIAPVLQAHGWERVGASDGNEFWRRPGKSSGNHSATFNGQVFYVFSANATPFEATKAYSPFAVYAILDHNGDYEAAARALRAQGYGDPTPDTAPGVDISGILQSAALQDKTAPLFDIQTFSETPERQIEWLWPGVIPRGMPSLVAGKQGLGKSFLICDIAARVSTGRPMPDGQPGTPGNVLLLAREDDASCVLLPRLKASKANLQRVWWSVFADTKTLEPLDLAQHIKLVTEAVRDRKIDLIVVDTFAAFAPEDSDSNGAQDVRILLNALTRLARETGAAVVVVAHLRKSGQGDGDPMDAIAGSHQMTAGVRVASMLEKGVGEGERWFRVVKSNLGKVNETGWTWRFAWADPFAEGAAEMPHLEWATAGNDYLELTAGRADAGPSAQAIRDACLATLADGPRPQRIAIGQALARLRKTYPRLNRDAVELAMDDLTRDGNAGVETWEGVRGASMIGLSGTRPESPEEKALRLARENPKLTVRELRALVGCRRDVAMQALRDVRETSGKDQS